MGLGRGFCARWRLEQRLGRARLQLCVPTAVATHHLVHEGRRVPAECPVVFERRGGDALGDKTRDERGHQLVQIRLEVEHLHWTRRAR